jgi:hypothetical protein
LRNRIAVLIRRQVLREFGQHLDIGHRQVGAGHLEVLE